MSVLTVDSLLTALPAGVVVTDPATLENYRYDWSRDPGAGTPLAVVRPTDATQVQTVVRWCAENRVPIVPRGAGTSLSGRVVGGHGGIVLSLERMRAIEIDTTTRVAVVEPGAFNAEVKAAAAEHGLWYPPDPSSYEICSIGGNIATNAGGLCCVKYGVTTDYVLGLDVVLADGELITLGGKRIKDVAGLSLLKLFVGSEGTLGIITRAILRLLPAQPPRATLVATFPDPESAARAVVALGLVARPSMVELMDNASINIVEDYRSMGLDREAGALLLVQSDAPGAACTAEIALAEEACQRNGATECFSTDDADEGEMFAEARRIFFPAVEGRGALLLEDVGAPVPQLPALFAGIAAIAAHRRVDIPVVAHAGDGNTHPTIVFDPADTAARDRAALAFTEIMELALSLGGTITGEHGIGRLKKELLPTQLGPRVTQLNRAGQAALRPGRHPEPGRHLLGGCLRRAFLNIPSVDGVFASLAGTGVPVGVNIPSFDGELVAVRVGMRQMPSTDGMFEPRGHRAHEPRATGPRAELRPQLLAVHHHGRRGQVLQPSPVGPDDQWRQGQADQGLPQQRPAGSRPAWCPAGRRRSGRSAGRSCRWPR